MKVLLKEGEALYIPSNWFLETKSIATGDEPATISVQWKLSISQWQQVVKKEKEELRQLEEVLKIIGTAKNEDKVDISKA